MALLTNEVADHCTRVTKGKYVEQKKPQRRQQKRWYLLPQVILEGLQEQSQEVQRTEMGSERVGVSWKLV